MKTPLRFSDSREIDPKEVLALYHYADWSQERTLEETQQVLAQSSLVCSLWEGPRLVAFARVLTDFIFRGAIYDVIVHPDVQRRGVGRALIYKVLTHPSLKRVPVFHLLTKDKRPFYEKLGFVTSEERGYSAMIFVRQKGAKK